MNKMKKTGPVLSYMGVVLTGVALAFGVTFGEPRWVSVVLSILFVISALAMILTSCLYGYTNKEPETRETVALAACHALVDAYDRGQESGGSIEWSDLDDAHEIALQALGRQ